jgi:Polysaccharide lyase
MIKTIKILSFLLLIIGIETTQAQLLWYADPSKPQAENFYNLNIEPNENGTLEVITDEKHGKVWQVNKPSGSKRTELSRSRPKKDTLQNAYTPKEGDVIYLGYQWKIMIEGNEERKGFAVFQNKSESPHSQNYPFNLDYNGKTLSMNTYTQGEGSQKSRGKKVWEKAVKENEWVTIVMGIKFSRDANIGHIELWINGEKQALQGQDTSGKLIHRTLDDSGNYFKWGAYNENSRPFNITVNLDEMRVAKDYKTANPLNYTTTPTAKVDTNGIPKNLDLFCPINKIAKRDSITGKYPVNTNKWYQEIEGKTQIFKLFVGDSIVRGFDAKQFHSRCEVGGIGFPVRFKKSDDWYMAEYTMKINIPKSANGERLKKTMTISQLFAVSFGPQFRLELTNKGEIGYGSRTNGNKTLLSDKDYSDGTNPLKVKMLSNGKFFKLFLNDKQIFFTVDGKEVEMIQIEESKKGTPNVVCQFRWGMYYNLPMYKDISCMVTDIVCKKVD